MPSTMLAARRRPVAPLTVPLRPTLGIRGSIVEIAVAGLRAGAAVDPEDDAATACIRWGTWVERPPFRRFDAAAPVVEAVAIFLVVVVAVLLGPRLDHRDENCRTRRVPQSARKRNGDIAWDVSFWSTSIRAVGEV